MKFLKNNILLVIPITLTLIIIISISFVENGGCNYNRQIKHYYPLVIEYSYEHGIDPELVFAVIKVESGFDSQAVSQRGAVGLMQIMPSTASYIANKIGYSFEIDLKNVDCNIALGCAYLAYLKQKFVTEKEILCAYNAGEGRVLKWLENKKYSNDGKTLDKIEYAETRSYVKKVLKFKNKFKKILTDVNYAK